MKTLTIKNLPDHVHAWLKVRAQGSNRSLNREVIHLLEQAASGRPSSQEDVLMERIRALRERFSGELTSEEVDKAIAEGRP